jgi:hypothetical protein
VLADGQIRGDVQAHLAVARMAEQAPASTPASLLEGTTPTVTRPPPSALLRRVIAKDSRRSALPGSDSGARARAGERKRSALRCIGTPRYAPGTRRGDSLTRW